MKYTIKRFSTFGEVSKAAMSGATTGGLLAGAVPVVFGNFGKPALMVAAGGALLGGISGGRSKYLEIKRRNLVPEVVQEPEDLLEIKRKYPELSEAKVFFSKDASKKFQKISQTADDLRLIPDWDLGCNLLEDSPWESTGYMRAKTGWKDLLYIHGDSLAFSVKTRKFYLIEPWSKSRKEITIPEYKEFLLRSLRDALLENSSPAGEKCYQDLKKVLQEK